MKPINSLIEPEMLKKLSTRSHYRYGEEIAEEGEITFDRENTFNLIAKVKFRNSQPRTAELMSTTKGFRWKCTCSSKKDLFCQHCVAVGLFRHKQLHPEEE
jgi:uncharacterized Zn finger protein